ncbi:NAD(P)H-hydrate dehydratase [Paraglaciecola mesophila]|uniref:Bifunctional NAD(P)H-hydrate repair enzyme n=1 Tax=Paraglaciecola mesophila TaxID=197222 RepID=A0ABU9SYT9_9ALTE
MQKTLTTLTENWAPSSLSQKVFLAQQVRQHEKAAATASGYQMHALMQRAGQGVFRHLKVIFPYVHNLLVVVGAGNNAGDGYVVATLAKFFGWQVTVAALDPDKPLHGDAYTAQQTWLSEGGEVIPWRDADFSIYDVVVDGILGTGLNGPVRGDALDLVHAINASSIPVLSIDVPSGLNSDTGAPLGACINADCTVTVVAQKAGLLTGQGKSYCGKLIYDDLDIADAFNAIATPHAYLVNYAHLPTLNKREANAHKGHFGRLLTLGANTGMPGSLRLTSEAALRTGAALVRAYCHSDSRLPISMGRPELMLASDQLSIHLDWSSCIAIGPGLGTDEWAVSLFNEVMSHLHSTQKPCVIDADGLNMLADSSASHQSALSKEYSVMTPHPGEAARLLGCSVTEIEQDRLKAAQSLANKYNAIAVLKGAGSIISNGEQSWICTDGNPGMATAGMGDTLTGIIAGLLAQKMTATEAALYGVCLHANAADNVAHQYGQRGMLASDLFEPLRVLVNPT